MYRYLPIALMLPMLAGCAAQPGEIDRGIAAGSTQAEAGPHWPDTSSERGEARLPGEFCDGFCRMRQQAESERMAETWREFSAREREAALAEDFDAFNAAATTDYASGDSSILAGTQR